MQALHSSMRFASVVLVLLLSAATSIAQPHAGKLSPKVQAELEGAISGFMAEKKVPGLSVAVVLEGEYAWSAGFGMADLENSVPATAQTVYRLASISKSLTATAAMVLWERGKLDLDSPVQKYYPAFPQKPWPITTRQLLGHVGGIRSYYVPEFPYSVSQSDPEVGNTLHFEDGIEAGMKFFANDPLVAEPGTHFNYSTQGYSLVGAAIAGASGKSYAEVVRECVLNPAGMSQTRPDDRRAIVPLRTRFYSQDAAGGAVNAEFLDASYKVPGGGWLSTAPDMARFIVAMLHDRLVKRGTRDLMWTPVMPSDGLGRMVYGLGWQLGETDAVKLAGHGGSQQGTSAMLLIAPDARAGVVVLTNSDSAGGSAMAIILLRMLLDSSVRERPEITVDPALLKTYVGTYQVGDFQLGIEREGDRLVCVLRGSKIPLVPRTAYEYAMEGRDIEIIFAPGSSDRAKELLLRDGGSDLYLSRIK